MSKRDIFMPDGRCARCDIWGAKAEFSLRINGEIIAFCSPHCQEAFVRGVEGAKEIPLQADLLNSREDG
jgi:hypothetical protein